MPARLLIMGQSARAAAQCAARAGFRVAAADLFGDSDTLEAAPHWQKLDMDDQGCPTAASVAAAIDHLAAPGDGVVLTSGFESRPALVGMLAELAETRGAVLLGNDSAAVAAVKDPSVLFPALAFLGVPHPPTRTEPPETKRGWITKQVGGSGGTHLRQSCPVETVEPGQRRYWQRHLPGKAVSVQVLGAGRDAAVLGFCEQWADPTPGQPFRFGGVALCRRHPVWAAKAQTWALAVSRHFRLRGLASMDFVVDESDEPSLIDINPRPGQSLDLFPHIPELMALHVTACSGRLPKTVLPKALHAIASAVIYAPRSGVVADEFQWPPGTKDIPPAGRAITAGQPLASLTAQGLNSVIARRHIQARARHAITAIIKKGEITP